MITQACRTLAGAAGAVLLAVSLTSPRTSQAQLLASEGFNYTETSLNGLTGGSGWDVYAWADPDADAPLSDDSASLAFPGSVTFSPSGKRLAFQISGEAERRLGTPISLTNEARAFYFSALVRRTGDFRIEFLDNAGNARWRIGANGAIDVATNAVVGVASDAVTPGLFPPGETIFLVSKMLTRATAADEVYLNVYREGELVPSEEPSVWQVTASTASGVLLTRLQIRNITDSSLEVDEMRVGTNYLAVAGAAATGVPVFARQPIAQTTVYEGMDAAFSVDVTGALPFSYQWMKDNQPLPGATRAVLSLTNLAIAQSGTYKLMVTNSAGFAESAAAVLTVLPISDISIGLQAMWRFDETNGLTAKDATANHNDGTLFNFAGDDTQWVPSEHIGALRFYGSNYVEMADSPSVGANLLNRFSVAGWFRSNVPLTANGNTYRMIEKENSYFLLQGDGNASGIGNGAFSLLVKKGGANLSIGIGQAVEANRWYHVAATFDGSNLRIYLDGELKGTRAVAAPIDSGGNMPLHVGSDYTAGMAGAKYFNGAIDELGLWSRPLFPSEILTLAGRSGPPVILTQPISQSRYAGGTATFTVSARGLNPLRYLWYHGTNEIRTANGPTLTLVNLQPADAGEYSCRVSNDAGEVFSDPATLTVMPVAGLSTAAEALWAFNESTGVAAADTSGKGRDGELRDYPDPNMAWVPGQVGGAITFDGAANRVVVTNTASLALGSDATFSFWMRPESYGAVDYSPGNYTRNLGRILNKGGNFDIYVIDDPGSVRATLMANGVNAQQNSVDLNTWQHWVVLYRGGTVSFFKNGFRLGDPAPGNLGGTNAEPIVIGSNLVEPVTTPWLFFGQMDHVGIWNRALNEVEIMTLAGRDTAGQPVIVSAPQSAQRYAGGTVSFTVDATGQRPLSYEWFLNGTPVPDSDTNRLAFMDLNSAHAGNYTVKIQNALGSVTTPTPAVLTILEITNVTAGLVAYWPMDETSGTTLMDVSGKNHHAALQNATASTGNPGVVGGAFFFDGMDDFAIVPHAADLNLPDQASIALWVSPISLGASSAGGLGRLLRKDINFDTTFFSGTSTLRVYGLNKAVYDAPANSFTTNQWQHVAIVAKNGTIEFFRNGRSLGTPVPGFLGPPVTNDLVIANFGPDLSIMRLFNGYMDDLGLWNRSLSAKEIDGIYQNGLLGKPLNAPFEPLQIRSITFPSMSQVKVVFSSPYLGRQHMVQTSAQLDPIAWAEQPGVTFTALGNGVTEAVFARPAENAAFYRIGLLPHPAVFSEDFETGAAGWTHSGAGDNWELGKPVNGPRAAYSGTNVYATSLTGNLLPYTDSWLRSRPINLTGLTRATLTFQEWRNVDPNPAFHGTVVNVLDASSQAVLQTLSTMAGGTTGYEARTLTLPAMVLNRNIILEFHVYCDDFNLLEGWYIDDVKIFPE